MQPSVSVVIPTYNRAFLVTRAVESVLAQASTGLETLVVDDGSTDNTLTMLAQFSETVRVISQANAGVDQARNVGVQQAKGDFIWFLDSDDVLLPGALATILDEIKKHPAADVFYGWAQITDYRGQHIQWFRPRANGKVWKQYLYSNPTPVGTFVVRRACAAQIPFNQTFYEDWDFLLRLAFRADFRCVHARLAEIEEQPVRRSTNFQPEETLRSVRSIYERLLADPLSGPLLYSKRRYLAANTYVMLGHQYRVMLNDRAAARSAFLKAVRQAPTFRRAYVGLTQSLLSASVTQTLRTWRDRWFRISSN